MWVPVKATGEEVLKAKRQCSDDRGFTLIELMIVILIIAILVTIAIPTFLGARRRSQDTQAKSHLRAALVAQKTYLADELIYTADYAPLRDIEVGLEWGNADAGSRGVIVEDIATNGEGLILHSKSRSGTLFCMADLHAPFDYSAEGYPLTQAGTFYAKRDNAGSGDCTSLVWEVTSTGWG